MRNRRLAQLHTSDDEDDAPPPPRNSSIRKRKKVHLPSDDDDELEIEDTKTKEQYKKKKKKSEVPEPEPASENEEQDEAEAHPVGEPIRFSGKGRGRRSHFESFEYDGNQYQLEDPVLLVPAETNQKPYVAIIKDIVQKMESGSVWVTGQWFYRPEEAEKKTGGNWQSRDTRELFYSFHRDDVPAESVMHKCVVHFIPRNKQIPRRKEHPGFIVQKVYDTDLRRLFKLTDKDYEDSNQHEIDLLVQKTFARLGDLPDIEPEDVNMDQEDQTKNKRLLRKKNVTPLDVSREDEGTTKSQLLKAETPGSTSANASEYYKILSRCKMLTGETQRDKWLDKLLQSIEFMCNPVDREQNNEEQQDGIKNGGPDCRNESPNKGNVTWPDSAVQAVTALEKAAHDTLSADFQKYNQKMRQLAFNLKNVVLARRLLNKELEPAQILNMSPNELKEGLTAEEIAKKEPEETRRIQMTNAHCKRCLEKNVGLTDIIQTGHGDRYQLECVHCGNTWFSSRDDAATLTIEGPSKTLVSPRGDEKGANDMIKKATESSVTVLESQQSFNKTRAEENSATNKAK